MYCNFSRHNIGLRRHKSLAPRLFSQSFEESYMARVELKLHEFTGWWITGKYSPDKIRNWECADTPRHEKLLENYEILNLTSQQRKSRKLKPNICGIIVLFSSIYLQYTVFVIFSGFWPHWPDDWWNTLLRLGLQLKGSAQSNQVRMSLAFVSQPLASPPKHYVNGNPPIPIMNVRCLCIHMEKTTAEDVGTASIVTMGNNDPSLHINNVTLHAVLERIAILILSAILFYHIPSRANANRNTKTSTDFCSHSFIAMGMAIKKMGELATRPRTPSFLLISTSSINYSFQGILDMPEIKNGKSVIIDDTHGIGLATAQLLLSERAGVIVTGPLTHKCDITSTLAISTLAETVSSHFGQGPQLTPLITPGRAIIFTTSFANRRGIPGMFVYAVSQTAIHSLRN
ncbi:uncharacterized protein BDR25DRAFT_360058 [Lindgomyces ingoldianus]|uniref:Uncharacterized protein n=1 Tax=Lindgomyces ingoldianus TaxID=673940 RepID=A0ACB6QG75_9PLEO|nr:uncharacterized protein BDR25DRAFT_360058 [Lindgomyces ingoldianus]KAF2465887.1 hypothetical protein BDR25DRAFT_360058 [Lindgomyces ingoldianus]